MIKNIVDRESVKTAYGPASCRYQYVAIVLGYVIIETAYYIFSLDPIKGT